MEDVLWNDFVGFWLAGLFNNSSYVIMLAGAKHISPDMVGLVYVANEVPSLLVKLTGPYWFHLIPYPTRMALASLLMALSFVAVAGGGQMHWQWAQLLGVALGSVQSGFGEASFLALTAFYDSRSTLTAWSSGTGFAGIFGYAWVLIFTMGFGASFQLTLLSALVLPLGFWLNYVWVMNPPRVGRVRFNGYCDIKGDRRRQEGAYKGFGEGGDGGRELGGGGMGEGGYGDSDPATHPLLQVSGGGSASSSGNGSGDSGSGNSGNGGNGGNGGRGGVGGGGGGSSGGVPRFPLLNPLHLGQGGDDSPDHSPTSPSTSLSPSPSVSHRNNHSHSHRSSQSHSHSDRNRECTRGSAGSAGSAGAGSVCAGYAVYSLDPDTLDPDIIDPDLEADMDLSVAATLTPPQRLEHTLSLWPYMVPLVVVYFAEYALQSGVWAAMGFPVTSSSARTQFYEYANLCYQGGVVVSRSSGLLWRADIRALWVMPLLQLCMLLFFLLVAYTHFWYDWALLVPCFGVGLLGGAVYVGGFALIAESVSPQLKEFSLATASVSNGIGVALANIAGIFIQRALYRYYGLSDQD